MVGLCYTHRYPFTLSLLSSFHFQFHDLEITVMQWHYDASQPQTP